ncbi:hypothetical protein H0X10_01825 [Candidatus Saccharibacteria bacterium]|nr:hypothetical protein [Candidatus Saccharibacteria bacterium]
MKILLTGGLLVAVLSVSSFAVVSGEQSPSTANDTKLSDGRVLTNNIDGIDVPLEVLEYVQFEYPGHAVTKAEKTNRNGAQVYRIRADRDDMINDYESTILLYDLKWKLIGNEKPIAPAKPIKTTPTPTVPEAMPLESQDTDKPVESTEAQESVSNNEDPNPPIDGQPDVTQPSV